MAKCETSKFGIRYEGRLWLNGNHALREKKHNLKSFCVYLYSL